MGQCVCKRSKKCDSKQTSEQEMKKQTTSEQKSSGQKTNREEITAQLQDIIMCYTDKNIEDKQLKSGLKPAEIDKIIESLRSITDKELLSEGQELARRLPDTTDKSAMDDFIRDNFNKKDVKFDWKNLIKLIIMSGAFIKNVNNADDIVKLSEVLATEIVRVVTNLYECLNQHAGWVAMVNYIWSMPTVAKNTLNAVIVPVYDFAEGTYRYVTGNEK